MKTVTNLSAKCELSVFSTLFQGLQRLYLVEGIDCNKKIWNTSSITDSLLSTSCDKKTPKQAHRERRYHLKIWVSSFWDALYQDDTVPLNFNILWEGS